MSELSKRIGARIASMRGYNRMTQGQLGGLVGVDKSTISGWESGNRIPRANHIVALCNTLNCTSDYLLTLVDNPHDHYGESK